MQTQPQRVAAVAWEAEPDTLRFRRVSPAAERLLGFPAAAWLEPGFWVDRLHPDDRERAVADCLAATESGEDHSLSYRLVAADGSTVWVDDEVEVGDAADGADGSLRGVIVDRTAERNEAALSRFLLRHTSDLISIHDADSRVHSVNLAVERLLGWEAASIVGTSFLDLVHPDDVHKTLHAGAEPIELRLRHRDGRYRRVEAIASPMPDGRVLVSSRDVTEQLRETEAHKMEALGRLAGSIAHDFNNVLFIIRGFAELLPADLGGAGNERVRELIAATDRGRSLTRQLLSFSRRQPAESNRTDIVAALTRFDTMVRTMLANAGVDLHTSTTPGLPAVAIACSELDQVLLNLVLNARDAMPDGGRVAIAVDRAGDKARIRITDTGAGMDERTRARVFEPYFTTKEDGTGIGLSNVFAIVSQLGGEIDVQAAIGAGTTFELLLPFVPDGPPRVLVVDDERVVREVVARCLEDEGYVVVQAGDLTAARAALPEGPFDVLVTDVRLADGLGTELALSLLDEHPNLHVVFMTGYGGVGHGHSELADAVLEKPFSLDELRAILARVIATGR